MLISSMATSGFSIFAFSPASGPPVASATTFQPRWESRIARAPRRTNPWSSATRIRSFFMFVTTKGCHYAHRCAVTRGNNFKSSADQFHSFLHAGDADADFEPGLVFLLL